MIMVSYLVLCLTSKVSEDLIQLILRKYNLIIKDKFKLFDWIWMQSLPIQNPDCEIKCHIFVFDGDS